MVSLGRVIPVTDLADRVLKTVISKSGFKGALSQILSISWNSQNITVVRNLK